ncbi:hypothetical protein [Acuticoccus sp.]|uniref:hypothetical protein n=1 Tax=Acuticoccus sp. TaxID=1904378 RepID=UPI003B52D389
MRRRATGVALAVLATVSFAGPAPAQETMSAEALAQYITGNRYTGVNPETGAPVGTVTYGADGSSTLTLAGGEPQEGSWRLDGDAYCTRYAAFRDNTENCFRLEPAEDGRAQAYYTDGRRALLLVPAP